ncbi:phosphatidylinositol-glycan biosynthesis class S protein [Lineolata rhizophorae]|uniref:Phosphatidylinositol-glycan biosynthesis class S protein n=1 Tax=Lineolata rhizophorae TaxID=578093 RepID=A0A6A6NQZ7_9PEZI|nr:phosphatidylinositol-glycan biosynthesis class S protein [Lineolata rhizophorae]
MASTDGKATVERKPPPESQESIRTRRLVILAFWSVAILLGLPIWWKTTTIYRAQLPLQAMLDWADGKSCRPVFPLRIALDAPSLSSNDAHNLLRTTQHAIDDLNDFSAHHLRLRLRDHFDTRNASQEVHPDVGDLPAVGTPASFTDEDEGEIALSVRLLPGVSGTLPRAELQPYSPTLDVLYAPNQIPSPSSSAAAPAPLATFIANELQKLFAEEQDMLVYLLSSSPASSTSLQAQTTQPKPLSPEAAESLAKQSTRSFKYAPTYHLTFSLFTPTAAPSDWEIEEALATHVAPLLESLSTISNFTVDTQVQLYAAFSPSIREPEYDSNRGAWTLRKEDVSGFINAAEWPLSPSIGAGPTVNFVLYVPSPSQTPLVVADGDATATSWLVPQWGSILILNPTASNQQRQQQPTTLTQDDLAPAMLTFSSHLLSLLSVPSSPPSLPLRLRTLTRVRAASLLLSASSTLGSLARLALALPGIAIPDAVADAVDETVARLDAACADLREGRFGAALRSARVAEMRVEKAFFEPSMVGQVYFPDEHKVAVYLPLLGPVAVPLLMAVVKEIKKLREGRGKKEKEGGEKKKQ